MDNLESSLALTHPLGSHTHILREREGEREKKKAGQYLYIL